MIVKLEEFEPSFTSYTQKRVQLLFTSDDSDTSEEDFEGFSAGGCSEGLSWPAKKKTSRQRRKIAPHNFIGFMKEGEEVCLSDDSDVDEEFEGFPAAKRRGRPRRCCDETLCNNNFNNFPGFTMADLLHFKTSADKLKQLIENQHEEMIEDNHIASNDSNNCARIPQVNKPIKLFAKQEQVFNSVNISTSKTCARITASSNHSNAFELCLRKLQHTHLSAEFCATNNISTAWAAHLRQQLLWQENAKGRANNNSVDLHDIRVQDIDVGPSIVKEEEFETSCTTYACTKCSYFAYNKTTLQTHMTSHSSLFINCDICSYKTRWKCRIKLHHIDYHSGNTVQCSYCAIQFTNKLSLKRHEEIHIKRGILSCGDCDYKVYDKVELKKHIDMNHTEGEVLCCTVCSYTTTIRRNLRLHMPVHKEGKLFRCFLCSYHTKNVKRAAKHMKEHTSEITPKYACDHCSYKTRDRSSFYRHTKKHSIDGKFKCEFCSYTSVVEQRVKLHVRVNHKVKRAPFDEYLKGTRFECPLCSYSTITRQSFGRHYANHTGEGMFCCSYKDCNYKVNRQSRLDCHIRKHTGEKYQCSDCSFSSVWSTTFNRHRLSHEVGKNFVCSFCSFKSNYRNSLTKHMTLHTGLGLNACKYCNFKNTQRWALKRHLANHRGIGKFCCVKCNFATNKTQRHLYHVRNCH